MPFVNQPKLQGDDPDYLLYDDLDLMGTQGFGAASDSRQAPLVYAPKQAAEPPLGTQPRSSTALEKLRKVYAEQPELKSPKWWQRGLGAAAGFGAGWSNAASRTRRPIDIGELRDNILAPGYKQKLAEWQSRVAPAQAAVEIEERSQNADLRRRQIEADEEYKREHGLYLRDKRLEESNKWIVDKFGNRINRQTGEMIPAEEKKKTSAELYQEALDRHATPQQALEIAYGVKLSRGDDASTKPITVAPGSDVIDPKTGRTIYRNQKAAREVDPLLQETREFALEQRRNADLEHINTTKLAQENQVKAARRREVEFLLKNEGASSEDDLRADPGAVKKLAAINRKYAGQLQGIQNNFASSARRRGIEADDYDVNPDTLEYKMRVPGGSAGGHENPKKLLDIFASKPEQTSQAKLTSRKKLQDIFK